MRLIHHLVRCAPLRLRLVRNIRLNISVDHRSVESFDSVPHALSLQRSQHLLGAIAHDLLLILPGQLVQLPRLELAGRFLHGFVILLLDHQADLLGAVADALVERVLNRRQAIEAFELLGESRTSWCVD